MKMAKVPVNVGYNAPVINTLRILGDIATNSIAWAKRCTGLVHLCLEVYPEVVTRS